MHFLLQLVVLLGFIAPGIALLFVLDSNSFKGLVSNGPNLLVLNEIEKVLTTIPVFIAALGLVLKINGARVLFLIGWVLVRTAETEKGNKSLHYQYHLLEKQPSSKERY